MVFKRVSVSRGMRFPRLSSPFVLAPMSGVTDVAFRVLCRKHGAAMTTTEFCSADGIVRGNLVTHQQLVIAEEETPVGIQLFGSSVDTVKQAAKLVEEKATVIDFNLGCPAWHILSQGAGSALLADPAHIEGLVREVSSALSKPFTVKLRLGLSKNNENYLEVARRCVDAGAVAVTLHGRTTRQGYSGEADWDAIKRLKQTLDVPVIGNGDVFTPEDANRMLDTGCDAVMIGRGARKNPFIFAQAERLRSEGGYEPVSDEDKLSLFNEYVSLADRFGLDFIRMKSHAMQLTKGVDGARHIRERLVRARTRQELAEAMEASRAV